MNPADPLSATSVVEEQGRFVVYLDVVFADGAVRHRLGAYHTRARAELAAKIVHGTVERDHRPEWGMP